MLLAFARRFNWGKLFSRQGGRAARSEAVADASDEDASIGRICVLRAAPENARRHPFERAGVGRGAGRGGKTGGCMDKAGIGEGGKAAASPLGNAVGMAEGQVGLGVDIVEIERMRRILARSPRFRERVFSADERAYCDAKANPEVHYATRFAAKEAVVKALGTGFSAGIGVRDIEVKRTAKGRPYASLTGRAREVARELGVRELPISLSFTHSEAVACAMAITEDSVRAAEKRVDPMEELARQFKEARSMLDELDASKPEGAR